MYSEDDLLPLSALQHLQFCPRQCALIHIEQAWAENLFTAQGRVLHDRVHQENAERRRDIRIEYGMSLRSLRLGLIGKADVIEFNRQTLDNSAGGGIASGQLDRWQPFPVEYKRGRKKPDNRDNVQLCAQALCLEEMLNCSVPGGAIYYGKERRRVAIDFDEALRAETEDTALRLRRLILAGKTPPPVYEKKCETCSLLTICLPKAVTRGRSVRQYLAEMTRE